MNQDSKKERRTIGIATSQMSDFRGSNNAIKEYCLSEGFNARVFKGIRGKVVNQSDTLRDSIEALGKLKEVFESLGYGPEDYIKYINSNPTIAETNGKSLQIVLPLLDYAGVLEKTLFELPHFIYSCQNPIELYSIIKWLKSSEDTTSVSPQELYYYYNSLNYQQIKALMKEYPFTKSKSALILNRFKSMTATRLKENKGYTKSLK